MSDAPTFTVALVGADGAGKSTVARRLTTVLPMPARYLYMGDNLESANTMLPTTRLLRRLSRARGSAPAHGPPDRLARSRRARPSGAKARTLASAKASARLLNRVAEEWYRQGTAWRYQRAGCVVIFDRHFFADYYQHDVAPPPGHTRTLSQRMHGALLRRLYPLPDLVVCLDAPPEVLLARKGEGTLELLEQRRREYFAIGSFASRFAVVDAGAPLDVVVREVAAHITAYASDVASGATRPPGPRLLRRASGRSPTAGTGSQQPGP